jgi:hypothetical protein
LQPEKATTGNQNPCWDCNHFTGKEKAGESQAHAQRERERERERERAPVSHIVMMKIFVGKVGNEMVGLHHAMLA